MFTMCVEYEEDSGLCPRQANQRRHLEYEDKKRHQKAPNGTVTLYLPTQVFVFLLINHCINNNVVDSDDV